MGKVLEFNSWSFTALEFFSGIGLARAGMSDVGIQTVWANDWDKTKCELYRNQWGGDDLICGDVFEIDPSSVPSADIAWASSPCTDLSLAGKREGLLLGRESSAFFGFIRIIEGMGQRRPQALVLENVCGLASSHDGDDFRAVVRQFNRLGYSVDAFEIDARRWLPQSRPRMFVVGLMCPLGGGELNSSLRPDKLAWIHADEELITHVTNLPPVPGIMTEGFTRLHERLAYDDSRWWDSQRQAAFENSLSDVQRERFDMLRNGREKVARTAYRRTRNGRPVWEMRPDDIAGCLRTARGGSSKQVVVELGLGRAQVRWMTGREYAALQGAPDFDFSGFSEPKIMYAFGDAVAVPAVSWLMKSAVIPSIVHTAEREGCRAAG